MRQIRFTLSSYVYVRDIHMKMTQSTKRKNKGNSDSLGFLIDCIDFDAYEMYLNIKFIG